MSQTAIAVERPVRRTHRPVNTYPGFTGPQAAKIAGVTYRMLDHWARTDFLTPSIATANGAGTVRLYSFRDLVALRVVKRLRDMGVSLHALRSVVERLEESSTERPIHDVYLVTDGNDVYVRRGDEISQPVRDHERGAFFFVIDLAHAIEEVRRRIDLQQ